MPRPLVVQPVHLRSMVSEPPATSETLLANSVPPLGAANVVKETTAVQAWKPAALRVTVTCTVAELCVGASVKYGDVWSTGAGAAGCPLTAKLKLVGVAADLAQTTTDVVELRVPVVNTSRVTAHEGSVGAGVPAIANVCEAAAVVPMLTEIVAVPDVPGAVKVKVYVAPRSTVVSALRLPMFTAVVNDPAAMVVEPRVSEKVRTHVDVFPPAIMLLGEQTRPVFVATGVP